MESLEAAAKRLLARLDARVARERADGFGVMVHAAICRVGSDRPLHREDELSQDRAEALPVRIGMRSRSAQLDVVPRRPASGEGNDGGPRLLSPFCAQVRRSDNDNRAHAGTSVSVP